MAIEEVETWVLELRDGKAEEEEGVGEKDGSLSLIKAMNIKRLLTILKTRLFPRGRANGTVGLPKHVLMGIP